MRFFAAALFACTLLAPGATHAQRDLATLALENHLRRCNNAEGEYAPEESLQGCTNVIRSDLAIGQVLAVAYNQRALRYLDLDQADRAMEDFNAAIRYAPHYAQAYLNRASLHLVRRDYASAVADYSRVTEIAPEHHVGYAARCWARGLSGADLALARADCDAALRIRPGEAGVLASRGFVGLREGDFQAAWDDYDAAVRANPASANHRFGRGVAARRLGREEQAAQDFADAAELDPAIAETFALYGVTP